MSRIIMLIPIDQNVSLTTISLSMIYFLDKNKLKKDLYQSVLYFSCVNNMLDDTTFIIKKYFKKFIHILEDIDFSENLFLSSEYFSLLNQVIEACHSRKNLYEFILIEGINYHHSVDAEQINYNIAQNLSAEVIFVSNLKSDSLECIKEKEKKITLFLKKQQYKNVLGVILNNINSTFIEKKFNFIKKLSILKKIKIPKKKLVNIKEMFKNDLFLIIACIPWNKNILQINTRDIYHFLELHSLNTLKSPINVIDEIIIFDDFFLHSLNKKYSNILIIIPFNRINFLIDTLFSNIKKNNISGIIITKTSKSQKYLISICQVLIDRGISIAFTKKSTIAILSQLLNFNFNIEIKDKIYIENVQKYISSFFCYNSIIYTKKRKNHSITYSPIEFCYKLKILSKKIKKRIILPESYEYRILKSVSICQKYNIADCILLGDPEKIYSIAKKNGIHLKNNTEIIDPSLVRNKYVSRLVQLRQKKGIDKYFAKQQLEDNTVLATLILESNKVDGLVSGSVNTTANTIRPALQIIKTNFDNSLVSSIFFMLFSDQVLIYADCAINIDPTAEELAQIAIQSADSSKIFGIEARIAMLSYSTGFSGTGKQVEKVRQATSIVKNRRPDLIIDGPIQYDAAVSETVSKLKIPNSPILGNATIFVFPDLNSGNIAYKAVQRSANLVSIGPILQGLRKPVNDLSRGASIEDIVYTIAVTSIQSLKEI